MHGHIKSITKRQIPSRQVDQFRDGRLHTFVVDSIERKNGPQDIELSWNGRPVGAPSVSGRW
jgi:hypothetical protein